MIRETFTLDIGDRDGAGKRQIETLTAKGHPCRFCPQPSTHAILWRIHGGGYILKAACRDCTPPTVTIFHPAGDIEEIKL